MAEPRSALDRIPVVVPLPQDSTIPTELAVEAFLDDKARSVRPWSLYSYRWRLLRFQAEFPMLPLSPDAIEDFCRAQPGKSDRTVRGMYTHIRALYFWLVQRRRLSGDDNPFLYMKQPKLRRLIPRIFTDQEVRRIVAKALPGHDRALVLTLLDGGPRIGELAGRTKDDLLPHGLRIDGKTGERVIPLLPSTVAYLRELPSYHLFPRHEGGRFARKGAPFEDVPAQARTLARRFTGIVKRAGVHGRKIGPHTIATQPRRCSCGPEAMSTVSHACSATRTPRKARNTSP